MRSTDVNKEGSQLRTAGGTLLDRALRAHGTKTALARELGVKIQTLVGWWSRGIPRHAVDRVRFLVERRESQIDTRQESWPYVRVPLVVDPAGGQPIRGDVKTTGRVPAYAPWAKKTDRCIRVVGHSMSPQFNDGDIVGIRKWTRPVEGLRGKFVTVTLPKQGTVVRRLNLSKNFVILEALNPSEPAMYIERTEAPEIWRVEWWHGHQP